MDKRRDYIRHHERLLDNRAAKVNELERQLRVIAEDVARFSATLEAREPVRVLYDIHHPHHRPPSPHRNIFFTRAPRRRLYVVVRFGLRVIARTVCSS